MTGNKIEVELRLMLDTLRKQVKQAADIIKSGLGKGSITIDVALDKAGKETDNLTAKTKRAVNEARNLQRAWLDAIRAGKDVPGQRPVGINTGKADYSQYGPSMNPTQGPMGPGGGLATPAPGLNQSGQGGQGGSSLFNFIALGAALASLRVMVGYIRFAFQALLTPMRMFQSVSQESADLMAKAITGGGGLTYTAQIASLSRVLGVGEHDVFLFSDKIGQLSNNLRNANRIQIENAFQLADSSYKTKTFTENLKALGSAISRSGKGIYDKIADVASNVVGEIARQVQQQAMDVEMNKFAIQYGKSHGVGLFAQEFGGMRQTPEFKKAWAEHQNTMQGGSMQVNSKRLAGSAWERMGFVVGRGGTDHGAQVAANTKRIANLTEILVKKMPNMAHEGSTLSAANNP